LTGALHDLQLQLSPPLPSSLAAIKLTNPGSPGKWPLKRRETDREGEEFRGRFTVSDANPPVSKQGSWCTFVALQTS